MVWTCVHRQAAPRRRKGQGYTSDSDRRDVGDDSHLEVNVVEQEAVLDPLASFRVVLPHEEAVLLVRHGEAHLRQGVLQAVRVHVPGQLGVLPLQRLAEDHHHRVAAELAVAELADRLDDLRGVVVEVGGGCWVLGEGSGGRRDVAWRGIGVPRVRSADADVDVDVELTFLTKRLRTGRALSCRLSFFTRRFVNSRVTYFSLSDCCWYIPHFTRGLVWKVVKGGQSGVGGAG